MRSLSRFIIAKSHNVKSSFVGQPVRSSNGQSARSLQTPLGYVIEGCFYDIAASFLSPFAFGEFVVGLVSWAPGTPQCPLINLLKQALMHCKPINKLLKV
ncbi:hypothetical protein AVEN_30606-1 [Araneus ventricosus]|uniref:Uncharacterized protein n=1 Tax=Araneus ventricosus TaxID=182803 RepID=A0A4Y2B750_ARAVE|nr:hypothetical protein AVEN_30606-1 [Araneus ventricosus]